MSSLDTKYQFRDEIFQGFSLHLLGPASDKEVLQSQPSETYSIGMLYPRNAEEEQKVDDVAINDPRDDEDDEVASLSNLRFPATMGLTFAIAGSAEQIIHVSVSSGRYLSVGDEWERTPISEPYEVKLKPTSGFGTISVASGLDLRLRVRQVDARGHVAVTLVLVNTNEPILDRKKSSEAIFFQSQIVVELSPNSKVEFVDRSQVSSELDDLEAKLNRLLFRHVQNYATGHGCAVEWDQGGAAQKIWTSFIPSHPLRLSESNPEISSWALDMRAPSTRPKPELIGELYVLIDGYEKWIDQQELSFSAIPNDLIDVASSNMNDCRIAAKRMRGGVKLLEDKNNLNFYKAFAFMSESMVQQRVRSEIVLAKRSDLRHEDIPAIWRPFQLLFILQCLEGLAHPDSPDREIADLLWFPTGGGKTEAYLGLISFTLMLRRIQGRSHGVSTIMRYTLRLLTTQQFERAALLMCCCEVIRREKAELGDQPFEVGLFIGQNGTPNSLKKAKKALEKLRDFADADVSKFGNPIQINICVWCGQSLGPNDHIVGVNCVARCPDPGCKFHGGLPWFVVDEDIYSRRPNLIIGTVDKFALLAVVEEAGNLFNRIGKVDPGLDLIIQDELHLISGPLGTLAGLYESAIDELGRRESKDPAVLGARAKLVASTATIRRASEQVRAVFDREICQFPPSALDSRNSYFAVESTPERKGTRRYVGVLAPGISQATILVRTYASLFHEATKGGWDSTVRDLYWTLVAYFSSLRILASAQLMMQDDVRDRLDLLNGGTAHIRQPDHNMIELTSRASATDIPKYLRQLRVGLPDTDTIETLLATNMISVGVDIDRLGLMVIAGQPQATAEYIQASSRVGRRDPGFVFTVYNSTKSRDRSHYESFVPYHSALYRQVEATSVTPFSPRARTRALHAAFVILCRFLIPGMSSNGSASKIVDHVQEAKDLIKLLLERVERVDNIELKNTQAELEEILETWLNLAASDVDLKYYSNGEKNGVLFVNYSDQEESDLVPPYPILMSMRDVDKTCGLYAL